MSNYIEEYIKRMKDCANGNNCESCPYQYEGLTNTETCKEDLLYDAAEEFERLYSRIPSKKSSAWIPVTERLPDFHEEVLIYAIGKEDGFSPVVAISEIYIFRLLPFSNGTIEWRDPCDFFSKNYEVTHWMPLPNAPEVDG